MSLTAPNKLYKTFTGVFKSEEMGSLDPMTVEKVRKNIDEIKPFHLRCDVLRALKKNKDYSQEGNYFGKTMQRSAQGISNLQKKLPVDENNLIERVREFNKTYQDNMTRFKELKEENEYFTTKYDLAKKGGEEKSLKTLKAAGVNLPIQTSASKSTFNELISSYRKRGYKIPDFSVKKNLFEPSSLLMENNKINDYCKFVEFLTKITNDDKDHIKFAQDLFYLQNLNLTLNDKLTNEDEQKKIILERTRTMRGKVHTDEETKTYEEILKENQKLEKEIRRTKELRAYHDKYKRDKTRSQMKKSNTALINIESNRSFRNTKDNFRAPSPTQERVVQKFKIKSALKNNKYLNSENSTTYFHNNTVTTAFETFRGDNTNEEEIHYHNSKSVTKPKRHNKNPTVISLNKQKTRNVEFKTSEKTKTNNNNHLYLSTCNNEERNMHTPQVVPKRRNLEVSTIINTPKLKQMDSIKSVKLFVNGETFNINNANPTNNPNLNTIPSHTSIFSRKPASKIPSKHPTTKNLNSILNKSLPTPTINIVEKNKKLEEIYEKILNKDYNNIENEIKRFYSEYKTKDLPGLENENVKPHDQLKFISELKNKVHYTNFMDIYNNFSVKNGHLKIDVNELKKVKELDERISELDFILVKELRKLKKD